MDLAKYTQYTELSGFREQRYMCINHLAASLTCTVSSMYV